MDLLLPAAVGEDGDDEAVGVGVVLHGGQVEEEVVDVARAEVVPAPDFKVQGVQGMVLNRKRKSGLYHLKWIC